MRKRVMIAGAVILVIGVATVSGGLYFLLDQAGVGNLALNSQKTTVVLPPAGNATIGNNQLGQITIIDYTDNASTPLQVSSGGATPTTRTQSHSGETVYVVVFTNLGTGSSASPIVMHNNQTKAVSVQYASAQSGLGALAYGGVLVLVGGGLFLVGLIVLVVGAVMKKPVPPTPQ